MKVQVGDRLVLEGTLVGKRRVGLVTGLHHADGTPPYDVRWLDTGQESVLYPGPDAHVERPTVGARN